jgi:hypothetical protein
MFLIKPDYNTVIKEVHLNQLISSDDTILQEVELIALEEMKSYLRSRYDVDTIFAPILQYSSGVTYQSGITVHDNYSFYTSLITDNNLPLTDINGWEKGDKRNQLLVMYLVDISLYHIHSRLTPNQIPENRFLRYETAITWLKQISKGSLKVDLPVLDLPSSFSMKITSNAPRTTSW